MRSPSSSHTRISAILLAAGLSRRMGGTDKLLLEYCGKPLLSRAIDLMDSLPVHEKILVTTAERIKHVPVPGSIRALVNPCPEDGQSGSMRLGVMAASGEYYLFLAADQPLLEAADITPVLDAAEENKIVYPTVEGNPCTPALFSAAFREELLAQSGDCGGRLVRMAHPHACRAMEAVNPGNFFDIDCAGSFLSLARGQAKS